MTSEHDEPTAEGADGGAPLPYKYRYKYLHKYGDAPADDSSTEGGEPRAARSQRDGGAEDDGRDPAKDQRSHTDSASQSGQDKDKDKDNNKDNGQGDGKPEPTPEEQRKQKRKKTLVLSIIALVFVLAAVAWLLYYLLVLRIHETTDDAYVQGDMVTISPRVQGTVVEVAVEETERVHAGQVLLRLDPVDAKVALMNAEGQLAQAVRDAQRAVQQANQADASVAQARAQYEMQRADYERRHPLLDQRAVSREEVDTGKRQMQAAYASLQQAQAQAAAAHAQVDGTDVHDFPAVVQARSQFRNAWVNARRDAIVSPIDGYAARRQVQVGQRVQPGQDLLTVVPLQDLWVNANFKETQLEHLRIGQPVEITTDMYSDVTYHGKVVGLTAGTGSAFALLPAQNASGNWIKVVQRLPVRISLDPDELRKHPLRIGLSTYIDVATENRDGQVLSQTSRTHPLASTAVYESEVNQADQRAEEIIRANTVGSTPAAASQSARGR